MKTLWGTRQREGHAGRLPSPYARGLASVQQEALEAMENIVVIVVIVLIVLFVLGYFGRGRMGR